MTKTHIIFLSVIAWTTNLQATLISNVSTLNYNVPALVAENRLEAGQTIYVDRTYLFASVPFELNGIKYIQTPNSAKGDEDIEITVTVSTSCTLYLMIDNRIGDGDMNNPPTLAPGGMQWVEDGGFADTGLDITAVDSAQTVYSVYSKEVTDSETMYGQEDGSRSFYSIAVGFPLVTDGLVMYLDAKQISGVADGSPLAVWEDVTGNDNDANQMSADNQPVYSASSAYFNSGTVQFDAVNDWMKLNDSMINVGSFTFMAVGRFRGTGSDDQYIVGGQNLTGDTRLRIKQEATYGNVAYKVGDSSQQYGPSADTDPHMFTVTSEMKGYHDGVSVANDINSSTLNPDFLNLGSMAGYKDYFGGELAAVLIYDRVLTEAEMTTVHNCLDAKYLQLDISDECTLDPAAMEYDFNGDCVIDFSDFAEIASGWLAHPEEEEIAWTQTMPQILSQINPPLFSGQDYPVTDYGAVGDGSTDCTQAFVDAITACNQNGGGRVVVPAGTFNTGAIHLKSNVNLYLSEDSTISFSTDPDDYLPVVRTMYSGVRCMNYSPMVYAYEQQNVAITGAGTLQGNGSWDNWWAWQRIAGGDIANLFNQGEAGVPVEDRIYGDGHYIRPSMIQFYRCDNILMEGVTVRNSPIWHIHPVLSTNITVRNVSVIGPGPNNDGCNAEYCKNVLIEGCYFDTGDDCVCVKAGRGADAREVNVRSENYIVRNCEMKDGHGGVVIGSEITAGARNIFVEDCLMNSPNLWNAIRLKSNSTRGGDVENVYVRNVEIGQVRDYVLKINFYYEVGDAGPFDPTVHNLYMTNVHSSQSNRAWYIAGYSDRDPLLIQNIVITNCTFENTSNPPYTHGVEGLVEIIAYDLDDFKKMMEVWLLAG